MKTLPVIENAWLAVEDGLISDFGLMHDWPGISDWSGLEVVDAEGKFVKTTGRTNMINITDLKKGFYYINLPHQQIYLFEKR